MDGGLTHTIAKGDTKGTYKLTATDTAAVKKAGQEIKVTASRTGKKMSTESTFKVAVKEMAKKEKEKGGLTLTPKNTTIKAGETTTVTVKIMRDKFDDEIVIKFEDLPEGVTIEDGPKHPISKSSTEKELHSEGKEGRAGEGGQVVKVHASFGALKAEGSFKLDVTSK